MKNKFPQVSATIYDGNVEILYDCPGLCAYALCATMPPDGSEECTYRDHGTCRCLSAQMAAIENLKRVVARTAKHLAEEMEA